MKRLNWAAKARATLLIQYLNDKPIVEFCSERDDRLSFIAL